MIGQLKIKKIKEQDIKKIIDKLSSFYDKTKVLQWKVKVIDDLNELLNKYSVVDFSVNKNSYMGIVLECLSDIHGEIYIKIVPPMIERFRTEIQTLMRLPKELTCHIYEFDEKKNAIVMEKINPGTSVLYYENKDLYKKLFEILNENKIEIDQDIEKNFLDFSQLVEHDYNIGIANNCFGDVALKLYSEFMVSYKSLIKNKKQYLLHGDLHQNNVMLCDKSVKVIDPLGFKAPFVMELLPICAYEMLNNQEKDKKDIIKDFMNNFSLYANESEYMEALFCQLVKLYIPSIFEANDGGIRAAKWLEIISEIYPEKLM